MKAEEISGLMHWTSLHQQGINTSKDQSSGHVIEGRAVKCECENMLKNGWWAHKNW